MRGVWSLKNLLQNIETHSILIWILWHKWLLYLNDITEDRLLSQLNDVFVTSGTSSRRYENLQNQHWQQSWYHENCTLICHDANFVVTKFASCQPFINNPLLFVCVIHLNNHIWTWTPPVRLATGNCWANCCHQNVVSFFVLIPLAVWRDYNPIMVLAKGFCVISGVWFSW